MAQHLYGSDGIHLHARGCSTLVANINKAVNIIKQKPSGQQDRQANRNVTPHSTQSGSNGYVSYAPDRASSRNGDSRDYQLQTRSYGYKNTHPDEAQGMAIHVTEKAGFRHKPAFTATEIMHQVMA
ncbi:hypothetical protein DPMN_064725 [Dreissena polymorpha]|uniref:Uncharacterized protein n=1 Tax=Dreissena polymorpha TaxID=45954 RepID=A0A9D4CDP0_DREPO|nr:hypothetical protein DPMN_064725 [Dreissena polymorpha]